MFQELYTLAPIKWHNPQTKVNEPDGSYYFMRWPSSHPKLLVEAPSSNPGWKYDFFFASIKKGQTLEGKIALAIGSGALSGETFQDDFVEYKVAGSCENKDSAEWSDNLGSLQVGACETESDTLMDNSCINGSAIFHNSHIELDILKTNVALGMVSKAQSGVELDMDGMRT
ncbi:hypothetical protein NE237_005764 [Protea cynaroides]|uniref:Uncharacterized protein n=1 Tax=Protea cynaroides TaxID=273540 RepID=A0A9Q0KLD0_9MAGN|nr:hypothetical protein NE237_005764 [Protea cynaroides]